jgi:hypothetical protein
VQNLGKHKTGTYKREKHVKKCYAEESVVVEKVKSIKLKLPKTGGFFINIGLFVYPPQFSTGIKTYFYKHKTVLDKKHLYYKFIFNSSKNPTFRYFDAKQFSNI